MPSVSTSRLHNVVRNVARAQLAAGLTSTGRRSQQNGVQAAGTAVSRGAAAASAAEDLDDIFGGLSAAKQAAREQAEEQQRRAASEAAAKDARQRRQVAERRAVVRDPVFGEEYDPAATVDPMNARVHRFDSPSGLNVYKAHAFGLGRGGGTRLCPFDCNCILRMILRCSVVECALTSACQTLHLAGCF